MSQRTWSGKSVLFTVATVAALFIAALWVGVPGRTQEPKKAAAPAAGLVIPMGSCPASFAELLKASQEQKKGVNFYLEGQTIGGVVVKAAGDGTVEVRNQEFGRIIIKLEAVNAVAMN